MSSFRDKLVSISEELKQYKNRGTNEELMKNYVQERLNNSVLRYYQDMFSYMEAVSSYNAIKVQKRLLKELKNKDDS